MSEMIEMVFDDAEGRMNGALKAFDGDLNSYRTGRATPQLLDRLVIEQYGVELPIIQLATVSVPEPQQLAIKPFDPNGISAIERAILKSDLGLTPNNDGKIIRLNLPRLTTERRKDLSKKVGKRTEEARVAVRNVRRSALEDLRDLQDDKDITEDQFHASQDRLQKLTDKYVERVNQMSKNKVDEIMEV